MRCAINIIELFLNYFHFAFIDMCRNILIIELGQHKNRHA